MPCRRTGVQAGRKTDGWTDRDLQTTRSSGGDDSDSDRRTKRPNGSEGRVREFPTRIRSHRHRSAMQGRKGTVPTDKSREGVGWCRVVSGGVGWGGTLAGSAPKTVMAVRYIEGCDVRRTHKQVGSKQAWGGRETGEDHIEDEGGLCVDHTRGPPIQNSREVINTEHQTPRGGEGVAKLHDTVQRETDRQLGGQDRRDW